MTRWLALGAIPVAKDNEASQRAGFESDLLSGVGGEAEIQPQPDASVDVHEKSFRWKLVESDANTIDLAEQIGSDTYAVAYAYAEVESPNAAKRVLGIGSDDAVRVWVNGELVHDHWVGRPVTENEDMVPVELKKGKNRLLLKVCNLEFGWGFACQFLSSEELAKRFIRAAVTGDQDTVEVLLKGGMEVDVKGKQGVTAYQLAKLQGQDHIAKFLKSRARRRRTVRARSVHRQCTRRPRT